MKTRIGTLAVLFALLGCVPALAVPATVKLRVEGSRTTLYEATVTTDGHSIEQDHFGPQPCDGTNGGANPTPGPTMTSALDTALAWDGSWSNSLHDFLINRIGPDAGTVATNKFWGLALNLHQTQLGGCQQRVKDGDEVLFAYDLFNKKHLLKLTGPTSARAGHAFTVKVVDGQDGKPVSGAKLGFAAAKTNAKGVAKLKVNATGTLVLKADRSDSVRSNSLVVRLRR